MEPLKKETPEIKPGLYDLTNAEYHSSAGISASHLKELEKSPKHYQAWLEKPKECNEAMLIGKAVHSLFLEPQQFAKEFAFAPECDKRTKEGKELYASFLSSITNQEIISPATAEIINSVFPALIDQVSTSKILTALFKGTKEKSFYWTDPDTGLLCKCRPDCLTDLGVITDLKTTYDASPGAYSAQIGKMRYFMQAAFYLDGVRHAVQQSNAQVNFQSPKAFVLVPIETSAPHGIAMYQLDEQAIELGRSLYKKLLALYASCASQKSWPGYSQKIETVSLPNWVFYNYKETK